MIKISASIVIYNESKETLLKIIKSFMALKYPKELVIVDNSPSKTLESFCQGFDGVKYIFSGENLGFGTGHNLAFKNLNESSDIHMIINPDTYFEAEEIERFLATVYTSEDISLATPLVCNEDGSTQNTVRELPSPLGLIKRKLNLEQGEIKVTINSLQEIPFAHGCFMIFKTDVFQKLGGFDERFFMYMEDVDIFIRAKQYGKTVIDTHYKIYHEYRKGSSKNMKLFVWHTVSAIKFFWKYKNLQF